jgi:predicted dehydrogenase
LGAGNFARAVLLPTLRDVAGVTLDTLCCVRGTIAVHAGQRLGFATATSDERDVFDNPRINAVVIATRHDQHARQVIAAIRAGKHVFVEKPLALTEGELDEIELELGAAGDHAGLLLIGFNRRFSAAARAARRRLSEVREPLAISIRLNAGTLPADHWVHHAVTGGGRIIGEACHAIDLATYLAGSVPVRVFAESVGGPMAPPVPDDRCLLTLRHANGTVTSIAYLSGGDESLPKERIEVFGGNQVVVIDDFRSVTHWASGKKRVVWSGRQDKGHRAELEAFTQTVARGGPSPIPWNELRATTLTSILAVRSLREGVPLAVR